MAHIVHMFILLTSRTGCLCNARAMTIDWTPLWCLCYGLVPYVPSINQFESASYECVVTDRELVQVLGTQVEALFGRVAGTHGKLYVGGSPRRTGGAVCREDMADWAHLRRPIRRPALFDSLLAQPRAGSSRTRAVNPVHSRTGLAPCSSHVGLRRSTGLVGGGGVATATR